MGRAAARAVSALSRARLADRVAQSWAARCGYGGQGNRTTCPCLHCGVWRQRDAARLVQAATVQIAHRIRQRAIDRAKAAARRARPQET